MGRLALGSGAPVAPPQALAAGIRRNTFNADMTKDISCVDINDTGSSAFKLFVRSASTTAGTGDANSFWPFVPSPPAANYAYFPVAANDGFLVQKGGVNLVPDNGSNIVLTTAIYDPSPPFYKGFLFGPGGYFEVCASTLGSSYNNDAFGPYCNPAEFFFSGFPNNTNNYIELDNGISMDSVSGRNRLHSATLIWNNYHVPGDGGGTDANHPYNQGFITDDFFKNGFLWKTMAQNNGVGLLQYYFNDVLQEDCTRTYTAGDTLARMDNHHYIVNFNNLAATFCGVRHMRAWQ